MAERGRHSDGEGEGIGWPVARWGAATGHRMTFPPTASEPDITPGLHLSGKMASDSSDQAERPRDWQTMFLTIPQNSIVSSPE